MNQVGNAFDCNANFISNKIKVDGVVLHLPYFLITATMLLFAIEKIFHELGQGSTIQNKFFALLVDYEILRSSKDKAGNEVLIVGDELEQSRDLIDLKDRLEESSTFFRSYLGVQVSVFQCHSHIPLILTLIYSDHRDCLQLWLLRIPDLATYR